MKTIKSEAVNESTISLDKHFYEQLPRFVSRKNAEAIGSVLLPVERRIELGGQQFDFTIMPAQVAVRTAGVKGFEERRRLPSDLEELLETVLRALAVAENANYDTERLTLFCSLRQLIVGISALDDAADSAESIEDQINIGLSTLALTNYILQKRDRQLEFRPFQELRTLEKDDKTFYEITFSFVFFNGSQLFKQLFDE
jgi:hypothetical protein